MAVPTAYAATFVTELEAFVAKVREEFSATEPDLTAALEAADAASTCICPEQAVRMLKSLNVVHNGIFAMSQDLEGLVETSSNLASVRKHGNQVVATTSQRSSVASNLEYMAAVVRSAFELGGAKCVTNEGYPGWKMNPKSEILKVLRGELQAFVRQRTPRSRHSRRSRVRSLQRKISEPRHGELRSHVARCALARRASVDPHSTDGMGSSARRFEEYSCQIIR